jgi:hypothetical protein
VERSIEKSAGDGMRSRPIEAIQRAFIAALYHHRMTAAGGAFPRSAGVFFLPADSAAAPDGVSGGTAITRPIDFLAILGAGAEVGGSD